MDAIQFDGQQQGERILSVVTPHPIAKTIALLKVIALAIFFFAIILLISTVAPQAAGMLKTLGAILSIVFFGVGLWWATKTYAAAKTFITDRRILRQEMATPFFQTKRALFWNEALKAKGFAPSIFWKMLKVGTLQVLPIQGEGEDVVVHNVYFYEDLANYIDKILFTFKNKPEDIAMINPFVPKPQGQRG